MRLVALGQTHEHEWPLRRHHVADAHVVVAHDVPPIVALSLETDKNYMRK